MRPKPEPTTMPPDWCCSGCSRCAPAKLPTARVHDARAKGFVAAWAILLSLTLFVCIAVSSLLNRIDTARAEAQRAYAHTAVLRVELEHVRATIPKPSAVDEVCRRRTGALRSAIFALVRTGNASMVGDPSWGWAEWPIATSSPTTRSTEAR